MLQYAVRVHCEIPPIRPERGFETSATVRLRPRYEDISQDGRLQLTSLFPAIGGLWKSLGSTGILEELRTKMILPIMQRLIIQGEPGPFSVNVPIECTGTWRVAREADGDRLFLDMWLEARAPHASTLGPSPPTDAEQVLVGRVYVEHVFTRPFAPPPERKVTRLDVRGLPAVPEDARVFSSAEALIAKHRLATVREHRFGLMHTDSNQHVNSLVYPRLFEEALAVEEPTLLAEAVELRYRKPFFAGDRAVLSLAKVASGIAVAAFTPPDADKPNATASMRCK
jgi:hypothetical protein